MRVLFQLVLMTVALSAGQTPALTDRSPASGGGAPVKLPPGYVIGVDDHLAISFWREKEMSADVVVRPDGRITLPLLNEIHAAGLTPDQLRGALLAAAESLVDDPNATVVVTEVHSRRAFITGSVEKPGMYPLNVPMTVLQLIATAGGLREFVGGRNIVIVRREGDHDVRFPFDYQAVVRGKNLQQNIELRPGDTVVVP